MDDTDLLANIAAACAEPDPVLSNLRITCLHHELSEALADRLGRDAGPNFHSWAVWGSRKAGATIRQEDLDSALGNASAVAGIVGSAVGAASGLLARRRLAWAPELLAGAAGAGLGALCGGLAGRGIAAWSRREAAALVLEGNRTVLQDIGTQSARFLALLDAGAEESLRDDFFAGLRPGPTERAGQDRLREAFGHYLDAWESRDPAARREAMIRGNCQIVHHEHIRLEPYIRGAMPWIVRRCATRRLMTFEIGARILAVSESVPGDCPGTAARDWSEIEDRMRYIYALFRAFHDEPEVFAAPFADDERAAIERGAVPSRLQREHPGH